MLEIVIPGWGTLSAQHLLMDFNGTLARDGMIVPGVRERLASLAGRLDLHVLTADTFNRAQDELATCPCCLTVLENTRMAMAKRDHLRSLGSERTVAIGNGRNDRLMVREAALGIAVVMEEGASVETVRRADVVCSTILDALDLLLEPRRLLATLRD